MICPSDKRKGCATLHSLGTTKKKIGKISTSRALKIIHWLLSSCPNRTVARIWSLGRQLTHSPRKNQDFVFKKLPSFKALHSISGDVHWVMGDRLHAYFSDAADQIFPQILVD